jgi:ribosomal protein S13
MTTKITIRLNDGKAADKRALTYLQTVGISYSKAVIKAINAYLDLKTEEERKDAFLQEVRNIVQEELRSNPMMGMMPYFQPPAEQKPTQETEDTMLAFLDAFDGE